MLTRTEMEARLGEVERTLEREGAFVLDRVAPGKDATPGRAQAAAQAALRLAGFEPFLRTALAEELRFSLHQVVRSIASLARGGAGARPILDLLCRTDAAAQALEDLVDLLAPKATPRRRDVDLAALLGDLLVAFLGTRRRVVLAAEGDCRGAWDADSLSHALAALLEQALQSDGNDPVRLSVRGLAGEVLIEMDDAGAPQRTVRGAISVALARKIIQEHGGAIAARGAGLAISLPRRCAP